MKENNDAVPGGLKQSDCLSLLLDWPIADRSEERKKKDLYCDGLLNLALSLWIKADPEKNAQTTLRRYAHVLRCQIPRKRL